MDNPKRAERRIMGKTAVEIASYAQAVTLECPFVLGNLKQGIMDIGYVSDARRIISAFEKIYSKSDHCSAAKASKKSKHLIIPQSVSVQM